MVLLNLGRFCHPEDTWQRPETFLVVLNGRDAAGVWWVEAIGAAGHLKMHRTAPQEKMIWHKVAVVPRLRNCFEISSPPYM